MEDQMKTMAPMMMLLMRGIGELSKAFYQKYGREALPVVTEVASRGGVEWGKIVQQTTPDRSMKAVAEMLKGMSSMAGMDTEIIELSDNKFHFKQSKCPLCVEKTSKELCEALMNNDLKMISTFLGKEVDMNILKSLAAGDDKCEVVYSTK